MPDCKWNLPLSLIFLKSPLFIMAMRKSLLPFCGCRYCNVSYKVGTKRKRKKPRIATLQQRERISLGFNEVTSLWALLPAEASWCVGAAVRDRSVYYCTSKSSLLLRGSPLRQKWICRPEKTVRGGTLHKWPSLWARWVQDKMRHRQTARWIPRSALTYFLML